MRKRILMYLLVALILVSVLAGFVWAMTHYVFVGLSFYPRNAETLDLRSEVISVKKYQKISEKLPDCQILWNVPLHNGTVPSNAESLTVTDLTQEDVEAICCMTDLVILEAGSCTDYAQLLQLAQAMPSVEVRYQVPIGGKYYSQDTQKLSLSDLTEEDAQNMAWLPKLSSVTVRGSTNYALLQRIQAEQPQWNLSYTVGIGGEEYVADAVSLSLDSVTAQELSVALTGLTELKQLHLTNPDMAYEELSALRESNSHIQMTWQVELYGQIANEETTELDISGALVESCEEVERKVAVLPNLEKLIMSDCGIDNETMAAFRERQRDNYKVVWTVYLSSKAKCRTDDTYFMPIQQGEYYLTDAHTENLKYCEDMVCVDVGHHKIYNIDFVAYMPKLKYLILAHTEVQDVSPIVNCQELIYLEVDWSTIRDYSPIAKLKKLEDLNLNQTYCDLTPLMEMTWLKNLWMPDRGYEWGIKMTEALPNTRVVLVDKQPAGQGWRNLQNYYDMRDFLGMPYMN